MTRRKKSTWWLKFKRIKRDFSSSPFIPFHELEKAQLTALRSPLGDKGGGQQDGSRGIGTLRERIKYVGLSIGRDMESKLNKAMAEIDGEFVDIKLISSALTWFALVIYRPLQQEQEEGVDA